MRDFLIQSCLLKKTLLSIPLWKIFISDSFKKEPLETEPTKLNILLQVFIWDHLPKSRLGKHHLSATRFRPFFEIAGASISPMKDSLYQIVFKDILL